MAGEDRGAFASRIGFILAGIGAAVGLGNIVLFPYRTATNGGASFLLIYAAMLLLVGVPALLAELAIGRRYRLNPYGAYRDAGHDWSMSRGRPGGGRGFAFIGVLGIIASLLLLSYYTVITGWAIDYAIGSLWSAPLADPSGYFDEVSQGPYTLFLHAAVMIVTIYIVAKGIAQGIERSVKVMIPMLFLTIFGVMVYALFTSGAPEGLSFYLEPDFSEVRPSSFIDAAGQTFFSIGIGFGLMVTYASYMDRRSDIPRDALTISMADFAIAVMAGFMLFPLLFTFGLEGQISDRPVGMIFTVLPSAFGGMQPWLGVTLALVFFIALTFAALSSAIALLEVAVATLVDEWRVPRFKASVLAGLFAYILGIGSALDIVFLDRVDALMILVLILSGLALSLFSGWLLPGLARSIDEGAGVKVGMFTVWMLRLVVPVVLIASLVLGAAEYCARIVLVDGQAWSACERISVDL